MARFFAFFTLFHLSLPFFRPEVPFKTSDHRFRAISALISAASPEKMDRYTKLRTTSGTMNIHQQSSPLSDHKYREEITEP